ncbi:MAG TPA: hypothetical protein ENN00_01365, partial [Bacillaceae bacterium]|nr:hypothetical protein [Bacillaceae bacterium]
MEEEWWFHSYNRGKPLAKDVEEARRPEWAARLLEALGHPEAGMRVAVVTGSKGKGTTAFLLARLWERLDPDGGPVGLSVGPHLHDVRERIRLRGNPIPHEAFSRFSAVVRPVYTSLLSEVRHEAGEYIGPLAPLLAVAFLFFRASGARRAVLEVGRGGLYDEVNVVPHEAAVITALFPEHLDAFGPTLEHVVRHKWGIVTRDVRDVFVGALDAEGLRALGRAAEERQGPLWARTHLSLDRFAGEPLSLAAREDEAHRTAVRPRLFLYGRDFATCDVRLGPEATTFRYCEYASVSREGSTDAARGEEKVVLPLLGAHQARNYALAYRAARRLAGDPPLAGERRFEGPLPWPGRLERLGGEPDVLVDGAISRQAAEEARRVLEEAFGVPPRPLVVVLGLPHGKDVDGVADVFAPVARKLLLVPVAAAHLRPADYAAVLWKYPHAAEERELGAALSRALREAGRSGVVLFAGTQTFV